MWSKRVSPILGVLFILYSTNAYACLFSMTLPAPVAMPMSMPMDSSMPSGDKTPGPCPAIQCDVIAAQDQSGGDCLLSSTASALNALKITQQDFSAPVLVLNFVTAALPIDTSQSALADASPRPLYSVSLLLLHSSLLL